MIVRDRAGIQGVGIDAIIDSVPVTVYGIVSGRIRHPQRIIIHVGVSVERLWILGIGHNRIRLAESPNGRIVVADVEVAQLRLGVELLAGVQEPRELRRRDRPGLRRPSSANEERDSGSG